MPNCQNTKLFVLPNELSRKELLDCWTGKNPSIKMKVRQITGDITTRAVQ